MIEFKNIKKKYKRKIIIDDFSLKINKGEFVTICGSSGVGKTTILNLIGKLTEPDGGVIRINGIENPSKRQIQKLRQETFGYIFQNFILMENETVLTNLKISKKHNPEWSLKNVINLLQEIGLDESYLSKKVSELSGGEQQRIAIARVMLKRCELILADEPTGNLDEENKKSVIQLLKKMKAKGKTIVCVTHDEEIAKESDRTIWLKNIKL